MNRAEEDALVLEAINGATSRNDVDGVEAIRLAIRAAVAHERERAARVAEKSVSREQCAAAIRSLEVKP